MYMCYLIHDMKYIHRYCGFMAGTISSLTFTTFFKIGLGPFFLNIVFFFSTEALYIVKV